MSVVDAERVGRFITASVSQENSPPARQGGPGRGLHDRVRAIKSADTTSLDLILCRCHARACISFAARLRPDVHPLVLLDSVRRLLSVADLLLSEKIVSVVRPGILVMSCDDTESRLINSAVQLFV